MCSGTNGRGIGGGKRCHKLVTFFHLPPIDVQEAESAFPPDTRRPLAGPEPTELALQAKPIAQSPWA